MLVPDVNVFVYAHRRESPRHEPTRAWLESRLTGSEPLGVGELVLSAFLRIVTHHRIYKEPTPPGVALGFCREVLSARSALALRPGLRHWSIFSDLCEQTGARGNVVPDAYLAALAIENGATLVTADSGFRRFPALRTEAPPTE
jgi:toxin-antitoxin system PIN domain toxin